MPKLNQNATVYVGEDVAIRVTLDPVVDITGWTIICVASTGLGASATKTISKGCTIVDAEAAVFEVVLTDDDTGGLEHRAYELSFWRTDAGEERPLTLGTLTALQTSREP